MVFHVFRPTFGLPFIFLWKVGALVSHSVWPALHFEELCTSSIPNCKLSIGAKVSHLPRYLIDLSQQNWGESGASQGESFKKLSDELAQFANFVSEQSMRMRSDCKQETPGEIIEMRTECCIVMHTVVSWRSMYRETYCYLPMLFCPLVSLLCPSMWDFASDSEETEFEWTITQEGQTMSDHVALALTKSVMWSPLNWSSRYLTYGTMAVCTRSLP